MSGQQMKEYKVAVVGGGIAGLALAVGLAKMKHIDLHVYESVALYENVGAGLAIHKNGIKAMDLIDPRLKEAYFERALDIGEEDKEMATEVIIACGPHAGTTIAELGKAKGRKTISRAALLAGFRALLPSTCISFGKKLKTISEEQTYKQERVVTLEFEDGTSASVDCLLGADGIHSITRAFLLGPGHKSVEPHNPEGWGIYRTMVPTEEALLHINPKWTRSVPIMIGPKGHVNCIPLDRNTRLSAGVAVRGVQFGPDGRAPPLDPTAYADYTEEAQQIVRLVAKDTSASWTAAEHEHAPFYAQNNVAILGDAAHAALPFAGNGASQALEDAAILYHLFGLIWDPKEIPSALKAYNDIRKPRSQKVADMARIFGRIYAFDNDKMHENPETMKQYLASAANEMNNFDVGSLKDER